MKIRIKWRFLDGYSPTDKRIILCGIIVSYFYKVHVTLCKVEILIQKGYS